MQLIISLCLLITTVLVNSSLSTKIYFYPIWNNITAPYNCTTFADKTNIYILCYCNKEACSYLFQEEDILPFITFIGPKFTAYDIAVNAFYINSGINNFRMNKGIPTVTYHFINKSLLYIVEIVNNE